MMKNSTLALTLFSISTLLVACGGGGKKTSKPCDVGVNLVSCGLDVREASVWGETISTYETDPQTKQKIAGSERVIDVNYEFLPAAPARWRRTITIDQRDQSLAMFQEGVVRAIGPQTLELTIERSSCDDRPSTETIYYQRSGGALQIDTQPIKTIRTKGFVFDAIGDVLANAMSAGIRSALETTFTFGSVRTFLTSGHGHLGARVPNVKALANAKSVCFNGLGQGFVESKSTPSW